MKLQKILLKKQLLAMNKLRQPDIYSHLKGLKSDTEMHMIRTRLLCILKEAVLFNPKTLSLLG